MDEIAVVLSALSAGAGAVGAGALTAVEKEAQTATDELVTRLRSRLGRLFTGRPEAQAAMTVYPHGAPAQRATLEQALLECGADEQDDILALAREIIAATGGNAPTSSTYELHKAKGVQINNSGGNTQTNHFS